jgi:hypothetical protein
MLDKNRNQSKKGRNLKRLRKKRSPMIFPMNPKSNSMVWRSKSGHLGVKWVLGLGSYGQSPTCKLDVQCMSLTVLHLRMKTKPFCSEESFMIGEHEHEEHHWRTRTPRTSLENTNPKFKFWSELQYRRTLEGLTWFVQVQSRKICDIKWPSWRIYVLCYPVIIWRWLRICHRVF